MRSLSCSAAVPAGQCPAQHQAEDGDHDHGQPQPGAQHDLQDAGLQPGHLHHWAGPHQEELLQLHLPRGAGPDGVQVMMMMRTMMMMMMMTMIMMFIGCW